MTEKKPMKVLFSVKTQLWIKSKMLNATMIYELEDGMLYYGNKRFKKMVPEYSRLNLFEWLIHIFNLNLYLIINI